MRDPHSDQVLHHVRDASVLCQMPHAQTAQIQNSAPPTPTFSVADKGSDSPTLHLLLTHCAVSSFRGFAVCGP